MEGGTTKTDESTELLRCLSHHLISGVKRSPSSCEISSDTSNGQLPGSSAVVEILSVSMQETV